MKLKDRHFVHMNGAGNSFFILDARPKPVTEGLAERAQFARHICTEVSGLRADGLVILQGSSDPVDFEWDFYNSDGSAAEMCGNAARCATRFFLQEAPAGKDKVRFRTPAGVIEGEKRSEGLYKVRMPDLKQPGHFLELNMGNTRGEFFYVNTGVPHLVVEGEPVADAAYILRRAKELGPAGANITFFDEENPGLVKAVTFERGVDDFTLACGTGAVAAAAFAKEKNPLLKRFDIEMPGGILTVEWVSDKIADLIGPAEFDYEIKLRI